jgi:cytidylate kinase
MPVITLSREMGSRGDDIALAAAERLGLQVVGREVINRAARAAGAPEVALAEIDELGLLGVKPSAAAVRQYGEKVRQIIEEFASQGNVLIAGRGGQIVLAGRPGVLHVRVSAPRPQRVGLVQERCGVPAEVAAARVDASDRARAGFLKRHHNAAWDDPTLYDVVLNMAHVSVAAATDAICALANALSAAVVQGASLPCESSEQ